MITIIAKWLDFDKYFMFILKSVKHCAKITLVFLLIYISYSYIGMMLFGGNIKQNMVPSFLEARNPGVVEDYIWLNFNDVYNGVIFLFYLMVGNNV